MPPPPLTKVLIMLMNNGDNFKIIARIRTDFPEKFGIPRQSGLVEQLEGTIVFEPEYRKSEALRGLDGFSHIWLLWKFSEAVREDWQPTVRPPRLGGNTRMGVFATRSPFRPNPIGLSCVKLEKIEQTANEGTVLKVRGADLMDGTPIYDIKPYLPYADSHPEALGGFAQPLYDYALTVEIPPDLLKLIPKSKQTALSEILANDPRPSYKDDPERVYGLCFAGFNISFKVVGTQLAVTDIEKL